MKRKRQWMSMVNYIYGSHEAFSTVSSKWNPLTEKGLYFLQKDLENELNKPVVIKNVIILREGWR